MRFSHSSDDDNGIDDDDDDDDDYDDEIIYICSLFQENCLKMQTFEWKWEIFAINILIKCEIKNISLLNIFNVK